METVKTNQPSKPIKFEFDVQLNWLSEDIGVLSAVDTKGVIHVAAPREFGGTGAGWSPEHLLVGSVSSCFMATYLSFVKRLKFEITGIECETEGIVEMMDGRFQFTRIIIRPTIYIGNPDFLDKAMLALEKAEKYCLISNSLNAKVECHGKVTTPS